MPGGSSHGGGAAALNWCIFARSLEREGHPRAIHTSIAAYAGVVLLLAKLCAFMEATTVPYVVEVLAVAFQGRGLRATGEPPQFVGGEVARRLGSAARELAVATAP